MWEWLKPRCQHEASSPVPCSGFPEKHLQSLQEGSDYSRMPRRRSQHGWPGPRFCLFYNMLEHCQLTFFNFFFLFSVKPIPNVWTAKWWKELRVTSRTEFVLFFFFLLWKINTLKKSKIHLLTLAGKRGRQTITHFTHHGRQKSFVLGVFIFQGVFKYWRHEMINDV